MTSLRTTLTQITKHGGDMTPAITERAQLAQDRMLDDLDEIMLRHKVEQETLAKELIVAGKPDEAADLMSDFVGQSLDQYPCLHERLRRETANDVRDLIKRTDKQAAQIKRAYTVRKRA